MNEWHPIETAPEDTDIIVWNPSDHTFYKAWSNNWDIADKYNQPHKWYCFDTFSGEGISTCHPSHWMLPEPPDS